MLLHILEQLNTRRIVLASASPRRRELLGSLGVKFQVVVSDFDETLPHAQFRTAADYAVATAKHKALGVCATLHDTDTHLVIGADTVVEVGGEILEKPADDADAIRMLERLSGATHHVHTGVTLALPRAPGCSFASPLVHSFATTTAVTFDVLSRDLVEAYVASGEPFGKAGGYGIQGVAGSFVTRVDGCYFNVVGFPLHDVGASLAGLWARGAL